MCKCESGLPTWVTYPEQNSLALRLPVFFVFFLRTHLDAACEQLRVQKSACELEEAEGALQQPSPDTPTNANTRVLYL